MTSVIIRAVIIVAGARVYREFVLSGYRYTFDLILRV